MGEFGEQSADEAMASAQALRDCYAAYVEQVTESDDQWWEELSYEDRVKAFRCICRRIHKGDVVERGSYRYVLYEVFGFGFDAYGDGMECGYMNIHNIIWSGLESERQRAQQIQEIADEELGSDSKILSPQE